LPGSHSTACHAHRHARSASACCCKPQIEREVQARTRRADSDRDTSVVTVRPKCRVSVLYGQASSLPTYAHRPESRTSRRETADRPARVPASGQGHIAPAPCGKRLARQRPLLLILTAAAINGMVRLPRRLAHSLRIGPAHGRIGRRRHPLHRQTCAVISRRERGQRASTQALGHVPVLAPG